MGSATNACARTAASCPPTPPMSAARAMNANASRYGGARTAAATATITMRKSSHLSSRRTTAMVHWPLAKNASGRQKAQGKRQHAEHGCEHHVVCWWSFSFCLRPCALCLSLAARYEWPVSDYRDRRSLGGGERDPRAGRRGRAPLSPCRHGRDVSGGRVEGTRRGFVAR